VGFKNQERIGDTMKENLIKLTFARGETLNVPEGTKLTELVPEFQHNYKTKIVAAKVDNVLRELTYPLNTSSNIQFVDLTDPDGLLVYTRSVCFLLIKAFHDLYPDKEILISHSISRGLFCEIEGNIPMSSDDVDRIARRMRELVEKKIPFVKRIISLDEAEEIFKKMGRMDRFHVIEHRRKPYITVYNCDGFEDYFYGYMVPDTGFLDLFDLKHYRHGLVLQLPNKTDPTTLYEFEPNDRVFNILIENKRWASILGVENVGSLNDMVVNNQIYDLIRVNEALHEKKIANIADMITNELPKKRIVLVSGPSSSGKTTFSQRLSIQLRANGLKPIIISLDDYFVDREHTPKDENGDYDFEAFEAIDIKLFNEQLLELLDGKPVDMPIFNFHTGNREREKFRRLVIDADHPLIIEGIHGLNPKLITSVPKEYRFKIYISPMAALNIDDHNRIPTTDIRLIRRIVRDFQFRGSNALATIKRWPSVRRGEERNIMPYQGEADIMFNSSLVYELGVLKPLAETVLNELTSDYPEYSEAKRLIEFLSYFLPIDSREVPLNSILREFIGGSCFYQDHK